MKISKLCALVELHLVEVEVRDAIAFEYDVALEEEVDVPAADGHVFALSVDAQFLQGHVYSEFDFVLADGGDHCFGDGDFGSGYVPI